MYVRVSTARQAQAQTIEQQLEQLRPYCAAQGWTVAEQHVYRDDGYSGASLARPGIDRLRDAAAQAACEVMALTAPDRLARKYIHQALLIEEIEQRGCAGTWTTSSGSWMLPRVIIVWPGLVRGFAHRYASR